MKKCVVLAIGNQLLSFDIIGVIMTPNFGGEFRMAFLGVGVCHDPIMVGMSGKENPFLSSK
jgi:hypothetical protein